jgi:hypothetical protein
VSDFIRLPAAGKYLVCDATGVVATLPSDCTCHRIHVGAYPAYVVTGRDSLALTDCLVPSSSGDPCSIYVPKDATLLLDPCRDTHVAIKGVGGSATVWIMPSESSSR